MTMSPKILIIDSHPVYILKMEGFLRGLTLNNIILTKTGKEGIEKAKSESPDLIILSGMLPDMNSQEVCGTVKAASPSAGIIVQVGLFTEDKAIEEFKECGADFVLDRKEKDLSPLQEAIAQLI